VLHTVRESLFQALFGRGLFCSGSLLSGQFREGKFRKSVTGTSGAQKLALVQRFHFSMPNTGVDQRKRCREYPTTI